jgi:hypothetical protein
MVGLRIGGLSRVKKDGDDRDGAATYSSAAGDAGRGGGQVSEFSGVVTDIREESRVAGRQRWQMALDQTEFAVGDVGMLEAVARRGGLSRRVLAGTLARGCSTASCLRKRCAMRVW